MAERVGRSDQVVGIVARALASALTEDPSLSEAELMREVAAATTALLPDVTDIELLSAVKTIAAEMERNWTEASGIVPEVH
jgi:hypothetical protein